MHKRHVHHVLRQIKRVSGWYFVIAILITAGVAVYSLRQNNLNAIQLRDKVLQVDKDNGDVESALRELRSYVYSHMNTKLSSPNGAYPPVQLKYRYERLTAAQKAAQPNNANLVTEAQAYCESLIPTGRSVNRIECIQNYMTTKGASVNNKPIPDSLYKFDFASPVWSPDLAGWSIVLLVLLVILGLVRSASVIWLKHNLRQ